MLSVALPNSHHLERKEHNHRLQKYRRWAANQVALGRPVTCWCLYVWISQNNNAIRHEAIRHVKRRRLRPEGTDSREWQGWRTHIKRGGRLSFSEYLAKREKLAYNGQGARYDLEGRPSKRRKPKASVDAPVAPAEVVEEIAPKRKELQPKVPGDSGLRMEPSSVLAKFARLGLLPKRDPLA